MHLTQIKATSRDQVVNSYLNSCYNAATFHLRSRSGFRQAKVRQRKFSSIYFFFQYPHLQRIRKNAVFHRELFPFFREAFDHKVKHFLVIITNRAFYNHEVEEVQKIVHLYEVLKVFSNSIMNAINAAYFDVLYNYRYVQNSITLQIVTTATRPYSTHAVQFNY